MLTSKLGIMDLNLGYGTLFVIHVIHESIQIAKDSLDRIIWTTDPCSPSKKFIKILHKFPYRVDLTIHRPLKIIKSGFFPS